MRSPRRGERRGNPGQSGASARMVRAFQTSAEYPCRGLSARANERGAVVIRFAPVLMHLGSASTRRRGWVTLLALLAFGVAACTPAAGGPSSAPTSGTAPTTADTAAPWQAEWDRTLAAAKREGRVSIAGPPGDTYRAALFALSKDLPGDSDRIPGVVGSRLRGQDHRRAAGRPVPLGRPRRRL